VDSVSIAVANCRRLPPLRHCCACSVPMLPSVDSAPRLSFNSVRMR
jgi:hypothetical protein